LSVVAHSKIGYLRPIRMGMRLHVRAWTDLCKRASWTIRDANTDVLCMCSLQVGSFIDPDTFNLVRMPPAIMA
jgi:acyl-CoA thioesterase FadM